MPDEHSTPTQLIDYAQSECQLPADGLFGVGWVTIWVGPFLIFHGATGLIGGPNQLNETTAVFFLVYGVYLIFLGGFLLFAGWLMRRAKHYPLCVLACVVALIPVFGPFVIGTFIGIWALKILRDPWVKKGFAANRADFDPDAAA